MKIYKNSAFLLLLAIFFTASTPGVAQNILQRTPSKEIKEAARQKTELWENELVLSAKQMSLMERKLIEFALKQQRILQSKMREEVKTRKLIELEVLEKRAMRDIFTKPQFDRYLYVLEQQSKKKPKS